MKTLLKKNIFILFLISFLFCFFLLPGVSAEIKCDSCDFKVESLDEPISLSGYWLFTREDNPENSEVDIDVSDWRLAKTPGAWKGIYDDDENYRVGWYRAVFNFSPELVGKEAVFLVDVYMAKISAFVDGNLIYDRGGLNNMERFYSIQPIPIRFKITDTNHVLSFRIDTILMTGVYQLPVEIREYKKHDDSLAYYHLWGGEVRSLAAHIMLFFGFFFILIYQKTKSLMYKMSGLALIGIYPFYGFTGDFMLQLFSAETLLILHYLGIIAMGITHFIFAQHFYKYSPKLNYFLTAIVGVLSAIVIYLVFDFNLDVFVNIRTIIILYAAVLGIAGTYIFVRALGHGRAGVKTMLTGEVINLVFSLHDVLLALGLIESVAMIFTGTLISSICMLWVASLTFANTFMENKNLVSRLGDAHAELENLVSKRTAELQTKTKDIRTMLDNLPAGVLTVLKGGIIHPEYSSYLEEILERKNLTGKKVIEVLFEGSNLGADKIAGLDAVMGAVLGEDVMNFEFNNHMMINEFEKKFPNGNVKSLEISWAPIVDDNELVVKILISIRDVTEIKALQNEASEQKRELDIIGEILKVSGLKFQEFVQGSRKFIESNRELISDTADKDEEIINVLFRNMHTIKGNARTYGFTFLTEAVHEAEQQYDELRKVEEKVWDRDLLLTQLSKAEAILEEYANINTEKLGRGKEHDVDDLSQYWPINKDTVTSALYQIDSVNLKRTDLMTAARKDIGDIFQKIGTDKLNNIIESIIKSVDPLAEELGKEKPAININENQDIFIKDGVFKTLQNSFMHLFRNSMDHGLGTPEERKRNGKPAKGKIDLNVSIEGDEIVLRYKDDGRGLDLKRIKEKAIIKGLMQVGEDLTPEIVSELIFSSGVSTAKKVTEISGRGVGLDAVRKFFEEEQGSVDIVIPKKLSKGAKFAPLQFELKLPANQAVTGIV
jgi:HPt (histidine-containing phosphotransfer) domain-containing protein